MTISNTGKNSNKKNKREVIFVRIDRKLKNKVINEAHKNNVSTNDYILNLIVRDLTSPFVQDGDIIKIKTPLPVEKGNVIVSDSTSNHFVPWFAPAKSELPIKSDEVFSGKKGFFKKIADFLLSRF